MQHLLSIFANWQTAELQIPLRDAKYEWCFLSPFSLLCQYEVKVRVNSNTGDDNKNPNIFHNQLKETKGSRTIIIVE